MRLVTTGYIWRWTAMR